MEYNMKEIELIAKDEGLDPDFIRNGVKKGLIVILKGEKPCGVGKGLRTKVNANIGTSPQKISIKEELRKLSQAISAGADTIMDLSVGGNLSKIRKRLMEECLLPFGTVPIYQAAKSCGRPEKITLSAILETIEEQAEDGTSFMTIHAGMTHNLLEIAEKRKMPVVSRGGSILWAWMRKNKKENPLYENFDEVLKIAKKHNFCLSLGDSLRPGCLADATDEAQIEELINLGDLANMARESGVSVIIEGPGHLPLHHIEANVKMAKRITQDAPLYLLGPLVTDIAPGYDHITAAIGGALASWAGADFLCYVTPAEHLGLPTEEDVKLGVIAARIAAHAGDIAKGLKREQDDRISEARASLDWKRQRDFAIDPTKFLHQEKKEPCSMCGNYCVFKVVPPLRKRVQGIEGLMSLVSLVSLMSLVS
ncbi:phosphomethylpyrimidine synthase ThiC [bacterium]|nr:phosphomethylpyrimidine synthase ThiC [bacterium]MBU1598528.1 phosphomethylpyrimidine synthase ThiC [bacterium]